jgi:hypothetical protein
MVGMLTETLIMGTSVSLRVLVHDNRAEVDGHFHSELLQTMCNKPAAVRQSEGEQGIA